MTIIIQAFIIIIALIVLGTALRKRTSHSGRAIKKIGLVALALAMIIAVIFPDSTNTIAHSVGVGRGADLVLYLAVTGFILFAINDYLYKQNEREMMHKLARSIAILEAQKNSKYRR